MCGDSKDRKMLSVCQGFKDSACGTKEVGLLPLKPSMGDPRPPSRPPQIWGRFDTVCCTDLSRSIQRLILCRLSRLDVHQRSVYWPHCRAQPRYELKSTSYSKRDLVFFGGLFSTHHSPKKKIFSKMSVCQLIFLGSVGRSAVSYHLPDCGNAIDILPSTCISLYCTRFKQPPNMVLC